VIQAVIFDCFGVLVTEGWYEFRDTYFAAGPKRQEATDMQRASDLGLVPYAKFESDVARLAGVSLAVVRSYLDDNVPNESLFRYIGTELKPHYRIGLLSNAAANWLEDLFTPAQRQLFDATALSYEMKIGKPDPRAYQTVAARLDVPLGACIFVDDSQRYCAAATELGMHAVWFKDYAQARTAIEKILADTKNEPLF